MINRRSTLAGLLVAAGSSSLAEAQSLRTVRKIGYLHPSSAAPDQSTMIILKPVWQRLGYIEGEMILFRAADRDVT